MGRTLSSLSADEASLASKLQEEEVRMYLNTEVQFYKSCQQRMFSVVYLRNAE